MKWGGWIRVVCGLVVAVAGRAAAAGGFEFAEITIDEVQRRMESGTLTAERLTEAYLARIEAVDRNGRRCGR